MQNIKYNDQHKKTYEAEWISNFTSVCVQKFKLKPMTVNVHQCKYKTASPLIKHHNTYLLINAAKLRTQTKQPSSIYGCCHPLQILQNPILLTS